MLFDKRQHGGKFEEEETAIRKMKKETGLDVKELKYNGKKRLINMK